jgi:hypothetical protein
MKIIKETMSLKQQWVYICNAGDLQRFPVLLTYKVVYMERSLSTNLEVRVSA